MDKVENNTVNLLLIEDNPGDARLVVEMLKDSGDAGFEVTTVENMASAISHLSETLVDVALVDLSLPDSNGLATVTQILALQPDVPIVVMTGMEDEELALNTVQEGAQDYLVKSQITPALLARTLKHAIERNRLRLELSLAIRQQEELATHDALTGLANRVLFFDRLASAINRAERNRTSLVVMFLDLDKFKQINDSLGHDMGDRILIKFAINLTKSMRKTDTAARLGGDEFVCLLENPVDAVSTAVLIAQKILSTCQEPVMLNGQARTITPSIGISIYPQDGVDASNLVAHADAAMYTAKQQGSGGMQFFNAELHATDLARLELDLDLRSAISNNELAIRYQPVVDRNAKLVATEALVRWQHPSLGLLAPSQFIALAESNGTIIDIDHWVLKTACQQNKDWQLAGYTPIRIAVNVAAQQFDNISQLVNNVKAVLTETGLDPQWLELEINESASMKDAEVTKAIVHELRAIGVQIAIDDFGTGYSSLSYLQRFEFDTLKIDRAFVKDVVSNPESAAITRTIMILAKALKMQTVAEGVESDAQEIFLKTLGCDFIQGFRYSKPISSEHLEIILRDGIQVLPAVADNSWDVIPVSTLVSNGKN